jgi:uncharacterized repeat protein (TIGR01451 family)/CSLREA domain-containing protein
MKKVIRSLVLASMFFYFVWPMGIAYPATTTVITVNSFLDVDNPIDNRCTLREAIFAANNNHPSGTVKGECPAGTLMGGDTIILPAGTYTLTIAGQDENAGLQGDLDITTSMTIQGAGPVETIIQAGTSINDSIDRVFHVNTAYSVHFEGLTIQHGNPSTPAGGGILIENIGTVSIDNCRISDNELQASFIGGGGGIANTGSNTLSITNSVIDYNRIEGTEFTYGGGVYNAIPEGTINIANTILHGNRTGGSGGALYNLGKAYLSNVSLIQNISDSDNNDTGNGGGIAGTGMTYLKNSLLNNGDLNDVDTYPDIHGNVISADYNIIVDIGDAVNFKPAAHDIVGSTTNQVDPDLRRTITTGSYQLSNNSLVLDQIPAASCTYMSSDSNPLFFDGEAITRDQRGAPRPNGGFCDIGAREFYSLTVTSTEDILADDGVCTLREAINTTIYGVTSGQTDGECKIPPDEVYVPAGTYTLAIENNGESGYLTGDLDIVTDLILTGAGAHNTIIQAGPEPGSGIDRVISVHPFGSDVFELNKLTVRHGQTDFTGAGLFVLESRLILTDVFIANNSAGYSGGGIYCGEYCDIFIVDSSIVGNESLRSGGGIFIDESTLTVANSTISNNQAASFGGGIYGEGDLYLSNVTVTANIADSNDDGSGDGGGINFFSRWNLKNSVIAGNIDRGGEKPDVSYAGQEIPSLDYNLIGDVGTQAYAIGAHDIVGTSAFPEDPQIGELTGSPAYQLPEPGSQVIDAIPAVSCTYTSPEDNPLFSDDEPITSDQTGGNRPVDGDQDGHFACDIGAVEYNQPELTLTKYVDNSNPRWTETVIYTIAVNNNGPGDATGAVISDTLPAELNYLGPLTLLPAGTTLPEPSLPTLADDLTIASGETISLTFLVSFNPGLATNTQISNIADVVCNELSAPISGSVTLTIAETPLPVYLPLVVSD